MGCGIRVKLEVGCGMTENLMAGYMVKNALTGVGFAHFDGEEVRLKIDGGMRNLRLWMLRGEL